MLIKTSMISHFFMLIGLIRRLSYPQKQYDQR